MVEPVLFAHGITGRATDLSTLEYVPLGIEHMLLGWDHLLFVLGIVLLAGQPQRAAKLISLFVLGHSVTLIAGTLLEWRLSPAFVDGVIALSVVYVGVLGLRGRPEDWTAVGATVFGFGLVHGLGLSTRLQELGIPDDGLLGKTLAFNVGLEIGQLLAVLVVVAVIRVVAPRVRGWATIKRGLFGAMACAGAFGALLLAV
jgi:hydrogenase/urease accessory protein HupE